MSEPIFFDGPEEFRAWLAEHHATESEVWVGMFKKRTGRQRLSWEQAVDQALCFGWIDGLLRRIDDERHMQRFTPRKRTSNWSNVNIADVERLEREGPGYRRLATHRVTSAKRDATRERRLAQLIEDSAAGRRLRQFARR